MTADANPSLALRITVESGGCHGFQYLMSVTNSESDINLEEDTLFVFDADGQVRDTAVHGEEARRLATGKAKVVMDSASLELLEGSKVDYTMELIGSQFKIVDNPRATSSCGCGTSFDVKI
jgi:Fe-S cluster assembly iron-binding protein IscA